MSEWQPIETAPRDETELLLWVNGGCVVGFFNPYTGYWDDGEYRSKMSPTHWMLPPEPPA